MIVAHVLGHADFSKNNELFRRSQEEVGYNIVEKAAAHARQIGWPRSSRADDGSRRCSTLRCRSRPTSTYSLDCAANRIPSSRAESRGSEESGFQARFEALEEPREPKARAGAAARRDRRDRRSDLLWFIANYAPELRAGSATSSSPVREESFYFYPVFACQIMNEGWASYWHARLLREADFLPQGTTWMPSRRIPMS